MRTHEENSVKQFHLGKTRGWGEGVGRHNSHHREED